MIHMRKLQDKHFLKQVLYENEVNNKKQMKILERKQKNVILFVEYSKVFDKQKIDIENYIKDKEKTKK